MKTQKTSYNPEFSDDEERADIEALRAGEYVRDGSLKLRAAELKAAAQNTLRKKPVTIRIQERDIQSLKVRAIEEGIPYQTLMSSIVHKYLTGRLVERTDDR